MNLGNISHILLFIASCTFRVIGLAGEGKTTFERYKRLGRGRFLDRLESRDQKFKGITENFSPAAL